MPNHQASALRGAVARLGVACALVAGLTGCAQMGGAGPVPPARVERLEALFVQTVPIGWMVDRIAATNANWPFQQHMGKVTPTQLSCVRGQMTNEKVSATQREDARAFARRYPDRVDEAIQLLEGGAAEVTNLLMRAGAGQAVTGRPVNNRGLMEAMSAKQLHAFSELTQGARYTELRQALRLDGVTNAGTGPEARRRGYKVGQDLMVGPLLSAMDACQVPPAVLVDKVGTPT